MREAELFNLVTAREYSRSGRGRELREKAGLSLREVAGAVGVSQVAVSRWERGERAPRGLPGARYGRLLAAMAELEKGGDVSYASPAA